MEEQSLGNHNSQSPRRIHVNAQASVILIAPRDRVGMTQKKTGKRRASRRLVLSYVTSAIALEELPLP